MGSGIGQTWWLMEILYISHSGSLGGAEQSLYCLVASLDPQRWQPCVVLPETGELLEKFESANISTLVTPMPPWRQFRNRLLRRVALSRLISRLPSVDLIHCNTIWSAPYARAIARRRQVPWVTHVRDLVTVRQAQKYLLGDARQVIAISDAVRRPLEAAGLRNVATIHNGVEIRQFQRATPVELSGEGKVRIGILGQIVPGCRWKGYEVFLEAAAKISGGEHFLVIGGDTRPPGTEGYNCYMQELEQLAASLGLAERVTFTGFRQDVPSVMASLDILVNASSAEPFGRTLIEAMAAGKPVIGTQAGGAPEIIVHGETGLLVPPNDVDAMAQAMHDLIQHSSKREEMGQAGYRRAVAKFSIQAHVRQIEAIYEGNG